MQSDGVSRSHIFCVCEPEFLLAEFYFFELISCVCFHVSKKTKKKKAFFLKELCIIMRYICNQDLTSCNVDLTESRIMTKILGKGEGICLV